MNLTVTLVLAFCSKRTYVIRLMIMYLFNLSKMINIWSYLTCKFYLSIVILQNYRYDVRPISDRPIFDRLITSEPPQKTFWFI